jgi:hypothetical protein
MRGKTNWRPRRRYNTYRRRSKRSPLIRQRRKSPINWRDQMELQRKWGCLRKSDYWFKHKV